MNEQEEASYTERHPMIYFEWACWVMMASLGGLATAIWFDMPAHSDKLAPVVTLGAFAVCFFIGATASMEARHREQKKK